MNHEKVVDSFIQNSFTHSFKKFTHSLINIVSFHHLSIVALLPLPFHEYADSQRRRLGDLICGKSSEGGGGGQTDIVVDIV